VSNEDKKLIIIFVLDGFEHHVISPYPTMDIFLIKTQKKYFSGPNSIYIIFYSVVNTMH